MSLHVTAHASLVFQSSFVNRQSAPPSSPLDVCSEGAAPGAHCPAQSRLGGSGLAVVGEGGGHRGRTQCFERRGRLWRPASQKLFDESSRKTPRLKLRVLQEVRKKLEVC